VKPANVLAINDRLKLASDSICRADEPASAPGKPSLYDPPEMAGGVRSPAADVWSLGMTLAEVLTQRLPSWNDQSDAQADPVVPDNLPAPFLEIVRGCVRRDPRLRLTIAGIAARLYAGSSQQPARVADAKPLPQEQPAVSLLEATIRRFAFPVVVAVLAGAALFAGLGLLRRQPQTQPDVAAVKPQHKPEPQELQAGKPSPKTLSPKTSSSKTGSPETKTGQQPGSAGNRSDAAPAAQVQPQPVRLISDLPTPASDRGASGGSSNSGPNSGPGGGVNSIPTSGSGDTADSGLGVVQRVVPNVPQSANKTIQGTIRISVKVKVDASGNVTAADLDVPGPSKYFARLSLEAAQRWKFAPSGPAGRQFVVHFEFRNTGPRAFATRARS
jgi:TonB family protein